MSDYWLMVKRRKWQLLVPFAVILTIATVIAFVLPPIYRSEATILVERARVPSDLVETTVTSYVQEQVYQIRHQLLSYENVMDLAKRHNVYPELIEDDPGTAYRMIRENAQVEMVDVRASDPDVQGERYATIAFTVWFQAETPEAARDVTNELSEKYLELHRIERGAQAAQVSEFLQAETETLEGEIAALEAELAQFKQGELQQLPELMDMNLRLMDRTEQELERARENLRALDDQIQAARAELSLTSPYREVLNASGERILTGDERLRVLVAEFMQASARYSDQHPDVQRLGREIRSISEDAGAAGVDMLMAEMAQTQDALRDARSRYSDDHPEVQRLERSLASVQRAFGDSIANVGSQLAEAAPAAPDNPRYVALQTQITATESNRRAQVANIATLEEKLKNYEERLYQTPIVERDFRTLSRDYDNALAKYQELKEKQLQARLAEQLEAGENAEQWRLVNRAYLPVLPDSPNRVGIVLLGFLFAMGAGIVGVGIAEFTDTRVRGSRMVANLLGQPPLVVIPNLKT